MFVVKIIIMTYNSLAPNVRLPFSIIRGTVAQRKETSINYVGRLYRDLYPKFMHGKVQIEDVQKSVDKVIGEKRKVHVLKTAERDYFGGQDVLISDYNGKISAITLELDTNEKFLKISDLVTIVHEFQHVADMFFHPKYAARYQYMLDMKSSDQYLSKYDRLYGDFLYRRENLADGKGKAKILKKIEYKFRNFLRKVPPSDRINYIQDARYYLLSEQQAYKTQLKFAQKLEKKHHPILQEDLRDAEKSYLFKEKLKMLNSLGFEILKKERLRIAKAQARAQAKAQAKKH